MSWTPTWFRRRSRPSRGLSRTNAFRPVLEELEARQLLSTNVLTYHNDIGRTGANLTETALTPTNVNSTQFGQLHSYSVDGQVYAEPLYVANLAIPGQGTHNVVFVATEHDSVYAFDADNPHAGPNQDGILWHDSFIDPANGINVVLSSDVNCGQIAPEIGITGTPVIDNNTGVMYLVAETKEGSGAATTYHQRLHALDITTGNEVLGGPVDIQASVPGTGDGGSVVNFIPKDVKERTGLLLLNGVVYTSFASNCDITPSHGWVIGYDASTLQQTAVFNASPNGQLNTIWMGSGALAADADGNIYFETGNGSSGPGSGNYDEAFVKLSTSGGGLSVADYFIPFNFQALDNADRDLGSGAPIVLPDQSGDTPHLLVGAGKEGRIYVINRDDMSGLNNPPNGPDLIVQELPANTLAGGSWDTPAYFDAGNGNRWLYYVGNGDFAKAFSVGDGPLSTSPTSQSPTRFNGSYGATPIVSANGTTNGIVWAVENASSHAVLHAYDATDLSQELYNSNQSGTRDQLGSGVKFATPTVADGKVFVPTSNAVAIFGLFSPVSDPGFETPNVGTGTFDSFQYNPSGSPWTFSDSAGVAGNGSGFTDGNPDAPQGTQVAFLQSFGSVSQSIDLAAGSYTVSFSAAQRGNFQASSQTFQVLVDGNSVGTFTPADTNYTAFTTTTFIVPSGGSHTLSFVGLDPDGQDNTVFLDQVTIDQV